MIAPLPVVDRWAEIPNTPDEAPTDLFRRWSMTELLAEPDGFEWLIRGMIAYPTYGMAAGEMKTLKSMVLAFIQVGLAAGIPIFDYFQPERAVPVIAYVGEGGRILYKRRLRRIAEAMGVRLADIPLYPTFDVAPVRSPLFQDSLARDLAEIQPGLVTLDPLYSYHGSDTKASDLHQEGALLNALSGPCTDAGASLMIVNHMNQTGTGMGLKRITMAGSGEWSDTWLLLAHRKDPDVENGSFKLSMQIGSRQWGGTNWELDLDIGRFDEDSGTHDGDIRWDLRRANSTATGTARAEDALDRTKHTICEVLADLPWKLTKTEVLDRVGGNREHRKKAFDDLATAGQISHDRIARTEGGTTKHRPLWGNTSNQAQTDGHSSTEDGE